MKKKLALLVVLALCLSAVLGVTSFATEATEASATTAAPEIAYCNVQVNANASLLFAVPYDGYTLQADGTVKGLQLLVWKGAPESYGSAAADAVLEAQGRTTIADKEYVVYVYDGLNAKEMTDTVYARTFYTDASGARHFGKVIDYSVTEWAKSYSSTNADRTALVSALLDYGTAMQVYKSYTPNGFYANQASALVTVTVSAKMEGGDTVVQQTSQLALAGSVVTLAEPAVDGCVATSWSVTDEDADTAGVQITVNADTEVTAFFAENNTLIWDSAFEDVTFAEGKTSYYIGGNETRTSAGAAAGINLFSATTKGIRINTGTKAYAVGDRYCTVATIEVDENGNKYLNYASNNGGAVYTNQSGGDTIKIGSLGVDELNSKITIKISLKRNASGYLVNNNGLRIRANGTSAAENIRVFDTTRDGEVRLKSFGNGGTTTNYETAVIGEVAEEGWTDFAIVVDFAALKLYGYMYEDGAYVLKATLDTYVPANYDNIYDWIAKVVKFQFEHSWDVTSGQWETIVPEAERTALAELATVYNDIAAEVAELEAAETVDETALADANTRLSAADAAYQTELQRITTYYFGLHIDNYQILLGNAVD